MSHAQQDPERLVVIRRGIGVIRPHRSSCRPMRAEMLRCGLQFAEAVATRFAVRRAGDAATMVFDSADLELKLSLVARQAPARISGVRREPSDRPNEAALRHEPPARTTEAVVPAHQQQVKPGLDVGRLEPTAPHASPDHEDVGRPRFVVASTQIGPNGGREVHPSPAPQRSAPQRHPPASPFEPVPRHPHTVAKQLVERVTERLRELDTVRTQHIVIAPPTRAPAASMGRSAPTPIDVRGLTGDIVRELERRAAALRERKGDV